MAKGKALKVWVLVDKSGNLSDHLTYKTKPEAAGMATFLETPRREALTEFMVWFERQDDGEDGVNYLNGDSDKHAGNGEDDLVEIAAMCRAALDQGKDGA